MYSRFLEEESWLTDIETTNKLEYPGKQLKQIKESAAIGSVNFTIKASNFIELKSNFLCQTYIEKYNSMDALLPTYEYGILGLVQQ